MEMERRNMTAAMTQYTTREDGGELYIEGYFSVFNSPYHIAPGVTEYVAPGAFAETLSGDVRALTNHDTRLVLGRSKAGTLTLREDARGLWGSIRVNQEDGDAMNLYHRIKRGDVDQCSFGFDILEEDTRYLDNGDVEFVIRKVELYEVSVVTFPAYADTSVSARAQQAETLRRRRADARREEIRQKLKGA